MPTKQSNKPLSFRAIDAMRPADKVKSDVGENRGLRVACGASGRKTFFYRYKSPLTGKLVQMRIGHFPETSLSIARERLQELKQIRRQGRCPATEAREQEKLEKLQAERENIDQAFTVEDLIELYLTQYIEDRHAGNGRIIPGARKPKGQSEVRRTLSADPVDRLGSKLAVDVTRKDIVDLVMSIVERGANVQAGSVLRELTSAYEFAIGLGRLHEDFVNPGVLAKASLKQTRVRLNPQRGKRVLSDDELSALLEWLPGSAFTATIKNVLRMTLWTGCRTGEICNAAWADFDLSAGTFHIGESKTGVERYVQLPTQAVTMLTALQMQTGEYPFASQKTRKPILQKQLTEQSWHLRQTNRMLDIPHWTPHDLRRTVRTGLSRLRCPNEVAEAVLGHARSGIEGTYDLHRYENECREWLQKWADHLDLLCNPSVAQD
jgi:integrase